MMLKRKLNSAVEYQYEYSVCTLVTDHIEYHEMVNSFEKAGFSADKTEFIYADNSPNNEFDAYSAINRFLSEARGKYIIVCHQDIQLIDDMAVLNDCISAISRADPNWAVLSNAGAVGPNYFSMLISYPNGKMVKKGSPPEKVRSVDENFILIKSAANLCVSADLHGFHMYGTDICQIADFMGYSCYTIPFNLLHKSEGKVSESFWESKKAIQRAYNRRLKGRWLQTTITQFYTSGSSLDRLLNGNKIVLMLIKSYNSLRKKRDLKDD